MFAFDVYTFVREILSLLRITKVDVVSVTV